ncbi:uncharacterized protein LOC105776025 [Gossypium raimondii]|uniref:uncharacterized protein LOC105776025 n=1 Tax=Gossypium raimondii TaxID=29730 RepID=UPI00227ADFD5|nr:uncharacterized protein LOC105776025 [Gossypium raimondii]
MLFRQNSLSPLDSQPAAATTHPSQPLSVAQLNPCNRQSVARLASSAIGSQLRSKLVIAVSHPEIYSAGKIHPPLTLHRHPMCAEVIEEFQKCHLEHPITKFFGECTELKIKLDRCFRQEKALKRKANFEQSKKLKERLQALRKETAENDS